MNFLNQICKPKLSDIELIAVDLTSEFLGIDSERDLFRKLPACLLSKVERSVYNRDMFRKKLACSIGIHDYYIVDSIPLEVCKLSRSSHLSICKEVYETAPDKGYCASQNNNYYGYKLHAICTIDGIFTDFDLTGASIHDIHYLKDIQLINKLNNRNINNLKIRIA